MAQEVIGAATKASPVGMAASAGIGALPSLLQGDISGGVAGAAKGVTSGLLPVPGVGGAVGANLLPDIGGGVGTNIGGSLFDTLGKIGRK